MTTKQSLMVAEQTLSGEDWMRVHGYSKGRRAANATMVGKAMAFARGEMREESAKVAAAHECGREDDIICQHYNCADLIAAAIRVLR